MGAATSGGARRDCRRWHWRPNMRHRALQQGIDPDKFALEGAPVNNHAMIEFDPTAH